MMDGTMVAASRAQRLQASRFSDLRRPSSKPQLVKGLLGAGEFSVWYGPPSTAKTFLLLELSRCVATGDPFFNRKVSPNSVLYVFCEGGGSFWKRIQALYQQYGLPDDLPIFGIGASVRLRGSSVDLEEIIREANAIDASLVIIDTLNRTFDGGNENESSDMGAFLSSCDRLRSKTGAHVAVVHHSGAANPKKARGHTSLEGAADTMVQIRKQGQGFSGKVTKNKDHDDEWHFEFELEVIKIGDDEDNDPITSCTIRRANQSPGQERPVLSGHNRTAYMTLQQLAKTDSEDRSNRTPVDISQWRDLFISTVHTNNRESSLKAFKRAVDSLVKLGQIIVNDGTVALARNPDRHGQDTDISNMSGGQTRTHP